jgi:rhamnogalacturonan endolyase
MADAEISLTHTLYHNDLSALPLGSLPFRNAALSEIAALSLNEIPGGLVIPHSHSSWKPDACFRVIERGLGKYIEAVGSSPQCENRILLVSERAPNSPPSAFWSDYRLRAVVTPLSFDDASPCGGFCGVIARYADAQNYLALVLDRDGQVKLLERRDGVLEVLDAKPLEFCLGQSLSLTLTVTGDQVHGVAGPYAGATHVRGSISSRGRLARGTVGLISDVAARFGPFTVECSPEEAQRITDARAAQTASLVKARTRYPKMRRERTVPLRGLAHGRNLRLADINGDGRLEVIVAQSSPEIAAKYSMTRLTCLTVLDLEGNFLWQAGIPVDGALSPVATADGAQRPSPSFPLPLREGVGGGVGSLSASTLPIDLPFQIHDLYADGNKVIVCVFGNDIQVRDGRTGKVLFSAATPDMSKNPIGTDYKDATSNFGAPWGDETLNMNVAAIAFCDTHGSGARHEIVVKDDFHHLAVLDALSSPPLQTLFRHRGNHGRYPWIADVDSDGRDEILAGYTLLDDSGKSAWSLPLGGFASAAAVLDPLNPGGENKRWILCANDELIILNAKGLEAPLPAGESPRLRSAPATRLSIAKFRADLSGLQILTVHGGLFRLHDATGKLLWSKELPPLGVSGTPVNWSGRAEEIFLYAMLPGAGLLDGHGQCVVEAPDSGPSLYADVAHAYCADGRDAVLAWDGNELAIYVPDDALTTPVYKPTRPNRENVSTHAARLSLPPNW